MNQMYKILPNPLLIQFFLANAMSIRIPYTVPFLSFLYVCMVNTIYLLSFVETPRKFIIAELSIRKLGSSSVLIIHDIVCTIRRIHSMTSKSLIHDIHAVTEYDE